MKTQPKPESERPSGPEAPKIVGSENLLSRLEEVSRSIARRAYELFEISGRKIGRDLDNWLRAEMEILRSIPVELSAPDDLLTVEAEVPGFSNNEIELSVEPRRVIIHCHASETAEQKKEILYSERHYGDAFRALDLPDEIDPLRAQAVLRNGILNITLPKVLAGKPATVEVKFEQPA
jgi:HSP20 family protein